MVRIIQLVHGALIGLSVLVCAGCGSGSRPLKEAAAHLQYGQTRQSVERTLSAFSIYDQRQFGPPREVLCLPLTSSFGTCTGQVATILTYENELADTIFENLNLYLDPGGRLIGYEYCLPD
jgi:hypothetical protein